jgi:CBS-domain-containing membrane protein
MSITGTGKRMTIYLGESDSWRGRSLFMSILETLRKAGIAGATASRGLAGFGAHSHLHTAAIERLSMDLPVIISVIDTTENVDRALALVRPMVREGLITLEEVEIVKYSHRYLQPLPADRPVSEIMTRDVTSVNADTPAIEIVKLLLGETLFKAVPVVDDKNHVIGIITYGDLLRKAGMPSRLSVGERFSEADLHEYLSKVRSEKTASEIMTIPVLTAQKDEAVGHVVNRMVERGLKRVPVVDDKDRLVGMLSRLDVLRAIAGNGPQAPEHAPPPRAGRTVGDLMTPDVPIVYTSDDLVDVLDKVLKADIKRVVVLDEEGRPVGIITDGDLVTRVGPVERRNVLAALAARVVGADMRRFNITAQQLMSENILSAPPSATIPEAISLMLREGRRRLVVVDEHGRPIGIVDRQTLMAASLGD